MRWSCRAPTEDQPWERWFAWYPIDPECRNEWIWLEWVERKLNYEFENTKSWSFWTYRLIKQQNHSTQQLQERAQ